MSSRVGLGSGKSGWAGYGSPRLRLGLSQVTLDIGIVDVFNKLVQGSNSVWVNQVAMDTKVQGSDSVRVYHKLIL